MLQARYRYKTLLEEFLAKELYSKLPVEVQELLNQTVWDIKISEIDLCLFVDCKNPEQALQIFAFKEVIEVTVKDYLDRKNLIDLIFDGEVTYCVNSPEDCPSECDGSQGCLALRFINANSLQPPN